MKIVCFGDSLTSCGGENGRFSDILQDRFPGHTFVNRGNGGESFAEALARFDTDVLAERPDVVLVEYGANDWWRAERPPEAWAADLEQILVRLRAAGAQPVVLGVFGEYLDAEGRRRPKSYGIDERAIAYRALEASLAARHGCPYVANIQERIIDNRCGWLDRNHPNEFGNRFVADTIEPVLERLLGAAARPVRKPTLATLRDFWLEALALAPERLAAVHGERRLTFAQADAHVRRLAAGLAQATGCEQPTVAVFLPNCLEYFLLYWAVARLGGRIVPLNTLLKAESLAGIFRTVRPDLLVLRGETDREPLAAAAEVAVPVIARLDAAAAGPGLAWPELFRDEPPPLPPIAPDAPAIIMHTSGTTATPKGAVMRHCDLMFNVMTTINAHQFSVRDVHLLVNPMFHCTALYSSLSTAAYTKTPVIITATTDPAALLELVARERVTTFLSVPTIFQRILGVPDLARFDCGALRLMAYAGSVMPVATIRGLREHFPDVELHNFFGLTETISMTHVLSGAEADTRPDSIGRLLPFVDARVVDPVSLAPLPANTVGELLFAREEVISGYFNQPGRIEEALVQLGERTWFRTGDLAMVDDEGYFFIRGRSKDMIIVGGENVYAAEVEGVLLSHPGVLEAAVKGVPATGVRKALGELVQGYVVARDPQLSERDLRAWCFERLASFKVPVRIRFLAALPRNPAGKLLKNELPV
jgi:acyl-CoA synthetase (AMP-forming)/AMP-acid ligase II/lysophospholipase L1-like esterase